MSVEAILAAHPRPLIANLGVTIYVAVSGQDPAVPLVLDQRLLMLPTWGLLVTPTPELASAAVVRLAVSRATLAATRADRLNKGDRFTEVFPFTDVMHRQGGPGVPKRR